MLVEHTYVWTYPGGANDSETVIWNMFFKTEVHDSNKVYIIVRNNTYSYVHVVDVIPCNHG